MPRRASYRFVVLTVDRHDDAVALGDDLRTRARRSGGARAHLEVTTDASVLSGPLGPGDPTTVVVLLSGSGAASRDPGLARSVERARADLTPVLPVFDPGAPGGFVAQVPEALLPVNGLPWRPGTSPDAVAAVLLRMAGLAESDRRIFLSYRRTDGTALADQLRHALADDGWDVFVDRFSVPPGVDFQTRLDRELADKAFVLLLETPDATSSPWVQHEVAFALRHGLGLLALTAPDTPKRSRYDSIVPAFRTKLRATDVVGPPTACTLVESSLATVLRSVDERHAAAFALRRRSLLESVANEMSRAGYLVAAVDEWGLRAERAGEHHAVYVTARAPEPSDVRRADELRRRVRRRGERTRGWIVHPLEDIDEDRASLMSWLCTRRLVASAPVMVLADRMGS